MGRRLIRALAFAPVWLALAIAAPPGALADDPPPATPEQIARARAIFERAEAARVSNRHAEAAADYLEAYQVLPDPEFLYNAGKMFQRAGDVERARRYLTEYLEADPDGRAAEDARRALAELPPPPAPRPPPRSAPPLATAQKASQPDEPGRGLRWIGLGTAGAGVVALGLGAAFALKARSIERDAEAADVYDPDQVSRGESAERNMLLFAGAGTAALITGGVLFYLGARAAAAAERSGPVAARPLLGRDVAGLAVEGSF